MLVGEGIAVDQRLGFGGGESQCNYGDKYVFCELCHLCILLNIIKSEFVFCRLVSEPCNAKLRKICRPGKSQNADR